MAKNEPLLRSRSFPIGHEGSRVALSFKVEGGLHYIKGNRAPYFSLTCWEHRKGFPNQCQGGGADHRKILRYYPDFADLAALHLSDIDGAPMHAEANGWYNLAGALGGMGEQFHLGNSKMQMWKDNGDFDGYRTPTPAECLKMFAQHCRISVEEAQQIADDVKGVMVQNTAKEARARWATIMETMRPRWQREAKACVAKHHLVVYGDPWSPEVVS